MEIVFNIHAMLCVGVWVLLALFLLTLLRIASVDRRLSDAERRLDEKLSALHSLSESRDEDLADSLKRIKGDLDFQKGKIRDIEIDMGRFGKPTASSPRSDQRRERNLSVEADYVFLGPYSAEQVGGE